MYSEDAIKAPVATESTTLATNSDAASNNTFVPVVTLTPSATIRNRYYQRLSRQEAGEPVGDDEEEDDEEEEEVQQEQQKSWPKASYYAPLKDPLESPKSVHSYMSSEMGSVFSLRTEFMSTDDTISITSMKTTDSGAWKARSRTNTIFRSRGQQPKLDADHTDSDDTPKLKRSKSKGASTLLAKLSKTTAPMRAKLSAMSRAGSTVGYHLKQPPPSFSTPLRRSAESMLNIPIGRTTPLLRSKGERSQSFSSNDLAQQAPQKKILRQHQVSIPTTTLQPALLSQVAVAFHDRVTVGTKIKDSIEYKDAFEGKEAVDKLCTMLKTKDRNLALLVGRALDAQKFFHDVNYEHRLRDSPNELYQFREFVNPYQRTDSAEQEEDDGEDGKSTVIFMGRSDNEDDHIPHGVFTLLTDCYSPTCSRENLCYSVFCPRRLEQQKEQQKELRRASSRSSLNDKEEDRLWIATVPKDVYSKLDKGEIKRQENIFELMYTEKDFVNDLAYVQKYWIKPLQEGDCIPAERRDQFVKDVFWNIMEVHHVNSQLAAALEARQKAKPVVDQIGDIMLQHVGLFSPFVQYGAHQMISKYIFETEKSSNPAFAQFVEFTERLPQSRKLELNGYLTKPTTRLGRYNLLLREVLKHTPADHPDQELIPKAMNVISEFLSNVNHETGVTENKFNLELLTSRLLMKQEDMDALDLRSENRKIIFKGSLKKKASGSAESADVQVYLLDHCLIIGKPKFLNGKERYKLYRKPIPLALLSISLPDQSHRRSSSILTYARSNTSSSLTSLNNIEAIAAATAPGSASKGYPITFNYLGRQGTQPITLFATTPATRRQWVDKIQSQRQAMMENQKVFDIRMISAKFFNNFNRVSSAASYGDTVILGSDQGVYIKREDRGVEHLDRLLAMDKVSQIDVLERSGLILVLADKTLYTFSLDSLVDHDTAKRGRKLSSHVSFFKVGTIFQNTPGEKTLVCFVRSNSMTSTIRALEPHVNTESKHKSKFGRLMRGAGGEGLKVYKDLYLPGEALSLQYFRNIICVGSPKGFQMVDLASADVQSVLDPEDASHHALLQRENLKPISMFRHPDSNILLCYDEMAFYIDKKGRRSRPDWTIQWIGHPNAFALSVPYIVAFDPTFIEVRHMDTGELVQVIPGKNVRCLKADAMDTIYCAMDDPVLGTELVFELCRV